MAFRARLLAFIVLVFAVGFSITTDTENHGKPRKKNIILIITDDQDQQMDSLDYMNHVQELLITEGTRYTRHYAPTALCCPARVSIMTGLLAHNHGVTSVHGINGGYQEVVKNGYGDDYLPIWLQHHGYDTYYTGKLYNGMKKELVYEHPVQGWTEADFLIGGNTYQYWHPSFQHVKGHKHHKVKHYPHIYNTHKVAEYAFGYLDKAVKKDDPFFIGIAPVTPHSQVGHNAGPPVPAPKYKGTLQHAIVPRKQNFNPEHPSGVNYVWQLDRLNKTLEDKLDNYYQRRVESLLTVDDIVKGVVERLKHAGKLDDTYIIYTSDNGFHLGTHRLFAGKKFAFEEDINVPFIIRGPDVPKGMTTDIVSSHIDIAPTIFKMAGIRPRTDFDGKAIAYTKSRIQSRTNALHDEYTAVEFWEGATFLVQGLRGKKPNSYKSLRLMGKGYDLMYSVQCLNNSHELYDMKSDPVQMRNLHPKAPAPSGGANAFHSGKTHLVGYSIRKLLWRLDALLLVLKSCKAKECRHPWHQLHPQGDVKNLREAMHKRHDKEYRTLPRIRYKRCYNKGIINLHSEGVQWSPKLLHHHRHEFESGDESSFDSDERTSDQEILNSDRHEVYGDEDELEDDDPDTDTFEKSFDIDESDRSDDFNYDWELLDDWE